MFVVFYIFLVALTYGLCYMTSPISEEEQSYDDEQQIKSIKNITIKKWLTLYNLFDIIFLKLKGDIK